MRSHLISLAVCCFAMGACFIAALLCALCGHVWLAALDLVLFGSNGVLASSAWVRLRGALGAP